MAIFLRSKNCLLSRLKSLTASHSLSFNRILTQGTLQGQFGSKMDSDSVATQSGFIDMSKWKKVNAKLFGITRSMIPYSPWIVLSVLNNNGFEAYLVGGCVRDLILNRIPKDFDLITTATLKQVRKLFHRSQIVGQRFPICLVHIKGSVIEVSSFETVAKNAGKKGKFFVSKRPKDCDEKDFIRWRNSMDRDFTINSLFFDPFMNKIYDYAHGIPDLKSLKLRTLIPAQLSFQEDPARILRGLRIAGRLGLSISKDTEAAIRKVSSSIKRLSESRIMMEVNYMLSYGASVSTICLLQKFNLLDTFLPFQAEYLSQQPDQKSAWSSSMLMKLFFNMDKLVGCDRPCHCSLWVGLLAFHQALVTKPRDALVIWVFASVLYHGQWKEGVKFARENAKVQDKFVPEISGFSEFKSDEELAEEVTLLASSVQDSVCALVDTESLSMSMSTYTVFPCSGLVFVPKKTGAKVADLFDVLVNDVESYENGRESFMIDYALLGEGHMHETRFVLGKVIMETLNGGLVGGGKDIFKEPEAIEEGCFPTPSYLVKQQVVVKKDKKRILLPFDCEHEQGMTKKQKLLKAKCFTDQKMALEQELVWKDESPEMANKHQKVGEMSQLPKDELIVSLRSMFEMRKNHSTGQKMSEKKNVTVGKEKYKDGTSKCTKTVEIAKHHMLHDKETKQQLNVLGNHNLSKGGKIDAEEKQNRCVKPVEKVVLQEKADKFEQALVEKESVRSSLSSLFKG